MCRVRRTTEIDDHGVMIKHTDFKLSKVRAYILRAIRDLNLCKFTRFKLSDTSVLLGEWCGYCDAFDDRCCCAFVFQDNGLHHLTTNCCCLRECDA